MTNNIPMGTLPLKSCLYSLLIAFASGPTYASNPTEPETYLCIEESATAFDTTNNNMDALNIDPHNKWIQLKKNGQWQVKRHGSDHVSFKCMNKDLCEESNNYFNGVFTRHNNIYLASFYSKIINPNTDKVHQVKVLTKGSCTAI